MSKLAELLVGCVLLRVLLCHLHDDITVTLHVFVLASGVHEGEVIAPEEKEQLVEQFDHVLLNHDLLFLLLRLRVLHESEDFLKRFRVGLVRQCRHFNDESND